MNGIPIIKAMTAPGHRWQGKTGKQLQPGDRVTAKVLDIGKNGMVRLDLGRITVMAALRAPVAKGMLLPLEVVSSAGPLLFKIRDQQRRKATDAKTPRSDETPKKCPPSHRTILGDTARLDAALVKLRAMNRAPAKPLAPLGPQRRNGKSAGEAGQPTGVTTPPMPSNDPVQRSADHPPRKSSCRTEAACVAISVSLHPMGAAHADLQLTPEGLHVTLRLAEEAAHRMVVEHLEALTSALGALAPSVRVDAQRQPAETSPKNRRSRHGRVSVDV